MDDAKMFMIMICVVMGAGMAAVAYETHTKSVCKVKAMESGYNVESIEKLCK